MDRMIDWRYEVKQKSQAPFFIILVDLLMGKEWEKSIFFSFAKVSRSCWHPELITHNTFICVAKSRGIAIPVDLDSQVNTLFTKSQMVMKHGRQWMTAGKSRRESQLQISRDYRSIIEGLQVIHIVIFPEIYFPNLWAKSIVIDREARER